MSSTETQDQILDAVQSVIVRDGVQGTSMRQVAQEADVSLGLLSYHFDDKDSLIVAAFRRSTSVLRQASSEATADCSSAEERVSVFIRRAFEPEFLNGDYLRLRVSLWAVALNDPDLARVDSDYYAEYMEELSGLIADARPDIDPGEIARRTADVVAYTNGLWLDWARFGDSVNLPRRLDVAEAMALAD